MKSELHMSDNQVEGSICICTNILFSCIKFGKWKRYDKDQATDNNTISATTNSNRTEAYVEALILAGIANEIMLPDSHTVVIYSNDGSAQSGVRNYVVKSFSINGKQRPLPTRSIFTESETSLKEMQLMTFKMLAASTGWEYTEKKLVEKIDFVVTDSTFHSLGVIEVCAELQTNRVPDSLACHVQPTMMFQRKIKAVWQEIHDVFGANTIKECFLTNVDFCNESFIYKAITCLCSFINSDYSSKLWNRQQHFDVSISPKKNASLSFKDHCFNRVLNCCINILKYWTDHFWIWKCRDQSFVQQH